MSDATALTYIQQLAKNRPVRQAVTNKGNATHKTVTTYSYFAKRQSAKTIHGRNKINAQNLRRYKAYESYAKEILTGKKKAKSILTGIEEGLTEAFQSATKKAWDDKTVTGKEFSKFIANLLNETQEWHKARQGQKVLFTLIRLCQISSEVSRLHWTYNTASIMDYHIAKLWVAANTGLGSMWTIANKNLLPFPPPATPTKQGTRFSNKTTTRTRHSSGGIFFARTTRSSSKVFDVAEIKKKAPQSYSIFITMHTDKLKSGEEIRNLWSISRRLRNSLSGWSKASILSLPRQGQTYTPDTALHKTEPRCQQHKTPEDLYQGRTTPICAQDIRTWK